MNFGYGSTFLSIDKGLIEKLGPSGISLSVFDFSSNFVGFSSSGLISNSAFIIISSAFVFLSLFTAIALGVSQTVCIQFLLMVFSFIVLKFYTTKL